MTRVGLDCEGGNAARVRASLPLPDIMFWYGTGSTGIPWTVAERALFPPEILAEIDQGGAGTPINTAPVRDVEAGAWSLSRAIDTSNWFAERRTIYCDRTTLVDLARTPFDGDVWLAWPGWRGEKLPDAGRATIIGVQDSFDGYYDHTTLLDATWPHLGSPPPPVYALSVTVDYRILAIAFTNVPGSDHDIIEYVAGPGDAPVVLERIPDAGVGAVVHGSMIHVPGSHGGVITVYAVVNSKRVLVGTRPLP